MSQGPNPNSQPKGKPYSEPQMLRNGVHYGDANRRTIPNSIARDLLRVNKKVGQDRHNEVAVANRLPPPAAPVSEEEEVFEEDQEVLDEILVLPSVEFVMTPKVPKFKKKAVPKPQPAIAEEPEENSPEAHNPEEDSSTSDN